MIVRQNKMMIDDSKSKSSSSFAKKIFAKNTFTKNLVLLVAILSAFCIGLNLQGCKKYKKNKDPDEWQGETGTNFFGRAGERYKGAPLFHPSQGVEYVGKGGEGVVFKVFAPNGDALAVKVAFYSSSERSLNKDRDFALALDASTARGSPFIRQALWIHYGDFDEFTEENMRGFDLIRQAIYDIAQPGKTKATDGKSLRQAFLKNDLSRDRKRKGEKGFDFRVVNREKGVVDANGAAATPGPEHPPSMNIDKKTNKLVAYEWADFDYQKYSSARQLSLEEVWGHLYMALVGLAGVHSMDFFHNDIARCNMVISNNGILKLADFGMANQRVSAGNNGRTGNYPPEAYGPNYFSKDDISRTHLTARDVFAVGIAIMEAATGVHVYQAHLWGLTLTQNKDDSDDKVKVKISKQDNFKEFQRAYPTQINVQKIDNDDCISASQRADVVNYMARTGLAAGIGQLAAAHASSPVFALMKQILEQMLALNYDYRGSARELLDKYFFGSSNGLAYVPENVKAVLAKLGHDPKAYRNY